MKRKEKKNKHNTTNIIFLYLIEGIQFSFMVKNNIVMSSALSETHFHVRTTTEADEECHVHN